MSSTPPRSCNNSDFAIGSTERVVIQSPNKQNWVLETKSICTVNDTTWNIVGLVTGAGMLSLPYAARKVGWMCVPILLICSILFIYTMALLGTTMGSVGLKEGKSYTELGANTFGRSFGGKLTTLALALEIMMALVSFLINIAMNVSYLNEHILVEYTIAISAVLTLFMTMLSLNAVAYTSAVGFVCISITCVTLALSGLDNTVRGIHHVLFNTEGFMEAVGLCFFCFGGHGAIPKLYWSMSNRREFIIAVCRAGVIIFLLYSALMVVGYSYYGQYTSIPITLDIGRHLNEEGPNGSTDDDNIHNYPTPYPSHTSGQVKADDTEFGDLLKVLGTVGIIVNLLVSCPLVTLPVRDMFMSVLASLCEPHEDGVGDDTPNAHPTNCRNGDDSGVGVGGGGGGGGNSIQLTPMNHASVKFNMASDERGVFGDMLDVLLSPISVIGASTASSTVNTPLRVGEVTTYSPLGREERNVLHPFEKTFLSQGCSDQTMVTMDSDNESSDAEISEGRDSHPKVFENNDAVWSFIGSTVILATASILAIVYQHSFAGLCAIAGTILTTINSIVLPIVFYHALYSGTSSHVLIIFHTIIITLAILITIWGVWASISGP